MIYDILRNLSRYETLSPDFATTVQYLRTTDLFSFLMDTQASPVIVYF